MLDVRRMQVLRTVVTSGSVTAAATTLGYTPSAISQQVAALEKEAGIALLERVGRGVRPTAAGLLLTEYSRHDRPAGRGGGDRAGRSAGGAHGTARRAVLRHGGCLPGGPRRRPAARRAPRRPGRAEAHRPRRPAPGRQGGPGRPRDRRTAARGRPRGHTAAAPARRHLLRRPARRAPLADRPALALSDLADEPWVGSESPGPCLDAELDACAAAGFRPRFVVESEDYTTAQGFVAAGLGVGLIPRLGLGSPHPDVVVRRLVGPEPRRSIHVAVRETAPAQPALTTFVRALRDAAHASGPRQAEPGRAATP